MGDDQRTRQQPHLSFQNPVHDERRWCPFGLYTGGNDYVRVQDNKSHLVFRRLRNLRT